MDAVFSSSNLENELICITDGVRKSYHPDFVEKMINQLLSERKERENNPGVWDGVPDNISHIRVTHAFERTIDGERGTALSSREYTRTLPKTKAREIAERFAKKRWSDVGMTLEDAIESAIIEAQKES